MVVLEAMACGIPVVATCSGGPDGIITDGKDGFLITIGDKDALADRLCRLLQDPALNLRMGRDARGTVESRYAEGVAGQAFIDIWDRLLAEAGES